MNARDRAAGYRAQTGRWTLTPKQRRRVLHKYHYAQVRANTASMWADPDPRSGGDPSVLPRVRVVATTHPTGPSLGGGS
jgi:hypothetical protein